MDIKAWANPLTVLSLSLVSINSLLMLYRLDTGLGTSSQLYLGCFCLAATMAHGVAHLTDFRSYRRRSALVAIGVYLLAFGLSAAGIATLTSATA